MPPVVRSLGEEQKVIDDTEWGGLNPLRGPSAALAAPLECIATSARATSEKTRDRTDDPAVLKSRLQYRLHPVRGKG